MKTLHFISNIVLLNLQKKLLEDPVTIDIGKMLESLSEKTSKPCISKVPNYLRQVNEKAYEPQVISIGPYHRGKDHLEAMEKQKILFLQKLLEEIEENDVSVYVMKMRELKDKAGKWYAPASDLETDDFVKVLLLDVCYDMLLVKNQLPFFVLWELFCMIERSRPDQDMIFVEAIFTIFGNRVPGKRRPEGDLKSPNLSDIKHLLDFMYHCCFHPSTSAVRARKKKFRPYNSTSEKKDREENPRDRNCFRSYIKHLLDFAYHCCFHPSTSEVEARREDNSTSEMKDGEANPRDRNCFRSYIKRLLNLSYHSCCHPSTSQKKNELNFIRCATQLKEAGIKFKLVDGNTMFDIRFENGTLHIPEIKIGDDTEPFLRNLIAYEQLFLEDRDLKHATDYMLFMDYLIDSPKDVEILCQHGIIENMLGDDKAVATMINSLGFRVVISPNFYYTEVFNKINEHRSRTWNRWMAKWDRWMENLKDKYFNSPWAFISFLAASLILLLTLLQTVISVLSYAQ
ncbi:UPF0481 protein At3g47200-like [Durio zibethinus]|uniref:UPF0481 protein At3g47200-like n=1 Tax=Durio zibethinus TaxID=66656 RepID=A0A6P5X340_DURZI|nr:UPF0481 protein At3g47200-like [Durio zibethinus]